MNNYRNKQNEFNMVTNNSSFICTSDSTIRKALKTNLKNIYKLNPHVRVIEELGIIHGLARIDLAVINGSIHGYELKSDLDTLLRLPAQMKVYNSVLDKVTLVVGKRHLYKAINLIPDWWGITIAKIINPDESVSFCNIREAEQNPDQDIIAIASLLWKEEALDILERIDKAKGVRSKTRKIVYKRLAHVLDKETLSAKVRDYLCARVNWKAGLSYMPSGG